MHQTLRLCRCGVERLALNDHHGRILQADQPWCTLRTAATGQKANQHFGHAELDFRIVGDNTIMARKGQFQATAQSEAVKGTCDRLCRGLTAGQRLGGLTAGFHLAQQGV